MIKFAAANPPEFVIIEPLTNVPHPAGLTFGHFVAFKTGGKDRMDEGDYVTQDEEGNPLEIIRAAVAAAHAARIERELARDLKQAMRTALQNMGLSAAQKHDLVNRILAVYVAINDEDLQGARFMANNTPTGGSYTGPVRTQLVAMIDGFIAQL